MSVSNAEKVSVGSTMDLKLSLKSSYLSELAQRYFLTWIEAWRYFSFSRHLNLPVYIGFQLHLPQKSKPFLEFIQGRVSVSNGSICYSCSFSTSLCFPCETQPPQGLSFYAIQAKEFSTHTHTLPKDVCTWWVITLFLSFFFFFVLCSLSSLFI